MPETSTDYYNSLNYENELLDNKINTYNKNELKDKQELFDEKKVHVNESINTIKFINNIMFGIYLLLVIVLGCFLYNKDMSYKAKILLLLLLLMYPFFITGLQDNIRFIYNYFFSETTRINIPVKKNNITELSDNYDTSINRNDENNIINYKKYNKQNSIIQTRIDNIKNDSSTNIRSSFYKQEKTNNYAYLNSLLLFVYYACVLGLLYELFLTDSFPFNKYIKIGIFLLTALYPFYINMVTELLIFTFSMIYAIISGQAYKIPTNYNIHFLTRNPNIEKSIGYASTVIDELKDSRNLFK